MRMKKSEKNIIDRFSKKIGNIILIIGASYIAYKTFGEKYLEQNNEIISIDKNTKKLFIELDIIRNVEERLNIIEKSFTSSKSYEIYTGGFLLFTTLEKVLFKIYTQNTKKEKPTRGLLDICKKLRSLKKLTRDDYNKIKEYICNIRNPLFHGKITEKIEDDLKDSYYFIKKFIQNSKIKYL